MEPRQILYGKSRTGTDRGAKIARRRARSVMRTAPVASGDVAASEHAGRAICETLLAGASNLAPVGVKELSSRIGDAAEHLVREAHDNGLAHRGRWISADNYAHSRQEDWPPAAEMVFETVTRMLAEEPTAAEPPRPGPGLTLHLAKDGERFASYDFTGECPPCGLYGDRVHRGDHYRTVLALEGDRMVGAAQWYYVDALNDEEMDTDELMGPSSVGPIFVERPEDYAGHVMGLHSFWVAPDRRRTGVARALANYLADFGVPAIGAFRDPLFAAFFLQEYEPLPLSFTTYGDLYDQWIEVSDEEYDADPSSVDLRVCVRPASPQELHDLDAPLGLVLSAGEDRPVGLGGLSITELSSSWGGDDLWGVVRVTLNEPVLLAWSQLADFLAGEPDAPPPSAPDLATALERRLRESSIEALVAIALDDPA